MVKKIIELLKRREVLLLIAILILGLIFRTYKLDTLYTFEHDQDLFSLIARDVLVDHHVRLIGQLTSIDGLFIGPYFYYLLMPFIALFGGSPMGAIVPMALLGILTCWSFCFVFSKLFNKPSGLIAAFIYSISLGTVFYDRWVVPTQPVILWSVWFLFVLFCFLRGDFKKIWLAAILVGLIWSIHVALAPLVILLLVAFLIGRKNKSIKLFSKKEFIISFFIFLILSLPLLLFETRHSFSQTQGIINSLGGSDDSIRGLQRFEVIMESLVRLIKGMFTVQPISIPFWVTVLSILLTISSAIYLSIKKILSKSELFAMGAWLVILVSSLQFSGRQISEYYLLSLFVPFILILSLLLSQLYKLNRIIVYILLAGWLMFNFWNLLQIPDTDNSFVVKSNLVEYIKNDADSSGYKCVGINYISKPGENAGFRYLYLWKNLNVVNPGNDVPVYSIVIPWQTSGNEITAKFGRLGVIVPKNAPNPTESVCLEPKNQLLDPYGFTN